MLKKLVFLALLGGAIAETTLFAAAGCEEVEDSDSTPLLDAVERSGTPDSDSTDADAGDQMCTLFRLIKTGNNKAVNDLLAVDKKDVHARDDHNRTPLMYAAVYGRSKIVSLLLRAGADVNAQDNDGDTALIHATRKNYHEVVELLLKDGANVSLYNVFFGWTALDLAQGKCAELISNHLARQIIREPSHYGSRERFFACVVS